jgi:hypothetical protein
LANSLSLEPAKEDWNDGKIAEITGKIVALGEENKKATKLAELEQKTKEFFEVAQLLKLGEDKESKSFFALYQDKSEKFVEIFATKREESELIKKIEAITHAIKK